MTQIGNWILHLTWEALLMVIIFIMYRGRNTALRVTKVQMLETNILGGITKEVAQSQLLELTNGTKSDVIITKKVSHKLSSLQSYFSVVADDRIVERRRRETINEGINELAKIVPNCEKNKGSILQRGVQYITQLKENETRNIEKWTLEKLLTDQAIAELSSSVDRLKNDLERAYREVERWKKTCQGAGLEPKETGVSGSEDDET